MPANNGIPVSVVIRETGVQNGVPAAIRIAHTGKAHFIAITLVHRKLNDRVVCTHVQKRRLYTHTHVTHILTTYILSFDTFSREKTFFYIKKNVT